MKTKSLNANPILAKELIKANDKVYYGSRLEFLNQINGWRPGKFHVLVGNSGGGKSTLIRTFILDLVGILKENKVVLWLSEETYFDFITEFFRGGDKPELFNNLIIYSEMDNDDKDRKESAIDFKNLVEQEKPKIVLMDNLTTSKFFNAELGKQVDVVTWFKSMAVKHGYAFICVCHTGKHISSSYSQLISEHDIQGTSQITKVAEFIFILQGFWIGNDFINTVNISKSRNQSIEHRLFRLTYNSKIKTYTEAVRLGFSELKSICSNRNKL